mmetsp:Transcript_15460/g.31847  ORF Transcript_15460/g.31847 Transcript_15460/m.31847 type:complete len:815 (-) Transcript_15460:13-2457(-)
MSPPRKEKILIVGTVGSSFEALASKLSTLNSSKSGPFDTCFCTGPFFSTNDKSNALLDGTVKFPIPVYFQDMGVPSKEIGKIIEDATNPYNPPPPNGIIQIAPNVHFLGSKCGLTTVNKLVVSWIAPQATPSEIESVRKISTHGSYLGCDILLSSEWPQSILSIIPQETRMKLNDSTKTNDFTDVSTFGDCDVADLAAVVRPRYHFATTHDVFCQAPVYRNVGSGGTANDRLFHGTRFIALNSVQKEANKDKMKKWIHAIGIETLTQMERGVLLKEAPNTVDSPYTGESFEKVNTSGTTNTATYGVSASSARMMMASDAQSEQFRWAGRGVDNNAQNKRRREAMEQTSEVDPNNDTLHISGLNKDPGGVINPNSIMAALSNSSAIESIRLPPGKAFGFIQFTSHDDAVKALNTTSGGLNISGVFLSLKWAAHASSGHDSKRPRKETVLEKDCPDSEMLFFTYPKTVPAIMFQECAEHLRKLAEKLLENAINGDGASDDRVTAETEPALVVQSKLALGKGFGFLSFASHAAAAMAIAAMTGGTDGGLVSEDEITSTPVLRNTGIYWSKAEKFTSSDQQDIVGLDFQRVRYPEDPREDCWFCLASECCEKHFIVSVGETAYVAMPKGPINDNHSLIIPVVHEKKGALCGSASKEVEQLKEKLIKHAKSEGKELFVFERNIETKGGYHPHVQCIPMSKEHAKKLSEVVRFALTRSGINMREVQNDIGVKTIINNLEEGEGYFYMEVPTVNGEPKRMIYVHQRGDKFNKVPIQFGRELAAVALGTPERHHWKACVVCKEDETSTTVKFRESITAFEKA